MSAVITLGGVSLPGDLAWPDQYGWQPVSVNTSYSLTGALLIETAEKQAGRPITLQSENNRGWVAHTTVAAIKALQADVGTTYPLVARNESHTVMILEVTATPLWDVADNSDYCEIMIKMITT